jgi:DNA (cytosine-5)-methyltransferase 1
MSNQGNHNSLPRQSSLFEELDYSVEQTTQAIKSQEAELRSLVDISVDVPIMPEFPPLILPTRWEALEIEARKRNVPLKPIIIPVQDAIARLEAELRQVSDTGIGRVLVISGVTGSGKTTFLNSLQLFIDGVSIHTIKSLKTIDRREDVENALATLKREQDKISIVVLEGKETPGALRDSEIDILLTTINQDFRRESGRRTLFVIPTTVQGVAQQIGLRAASIGGMTSTNRPFMVFGGPQKNDFISITDDTLRALNDSRTLLEYGVADDVAKGLAESADSIGAFIEACYDEIQRHRDSLRTASINLKRKRIHLWMVFCSLEIDTRRNHDIIRSLTFGDSQHVQVSRLLIGDSEEVRFWESRKGAFAQAAQYLDLRVMYLPLRTVNAVATAYGQDALIRQLKSQDLIQRQATRASAQDSIASTAIGAFLRKEGFIDRDPSRRGRPDDAQRAIYRETVRLAAKEEYVLNAAIAQALRDWQKHPEMSVATELSLTETRKLVTDVAVVTPTDVYCLEMKWRSDVLHESEVIRQTAGRVRDFATELPELRNLIEL